MNHIYISIMFINNMEASLYENVVSGCLFGKKPNKILMSLLKSKTQY